MPRLFTAIRPPTAIRQQLTGLMGGVRGARWQEDDQIHLTLRFIGEVDRHMAADVAAVLGQVRHPPFEIALNSLGEFDRRGRRDTLWAGVAPHDQLVALHNKIDQALARIGLPPETRTYLPHITLARFGREAGDIEGFASHYGGLSSTPFPVGHFILFESSLGREGARYDVVERYALTV